MLLVNNYCFVVLSHNDDRPFSLAATTKTESQTVRPQYPNRWLSSFNHGSLPLDRLSTTLLVSSSQQIKLLMETGTGCISMETGMGNLTMDLMETGTSKSIAYMLHAACCVLTIESIYTVLPLPPDRRFVFTLFVGTDIASNGEKLTAFFHGQSHSVGT